MTNQCERHPHSVMGGVECLSCVVEENGRLRALNAEMLEALKGLMLTEDGLQTGIDHSLAVNRAREVIAKAEGR